MVNPAVRHMPSIHPRYPLCERVAREAVADFSRITMDLEPPIPVESLASSLGFQIVRLFTVGGEFSGLVSPRHKLIGINGNHHRHRQRFTVAHEIAHILLKHPPESRCTMKEITLYNIEADACASELLIPHSLLSGWLRKTSQVSFLARLFDVSEEAIERKMRLLAPVTV